MDGREDVQKQPEEFTACVATFSHQYNDTTSTTATNNSAAPPIKKMVKWIFFCNGQNNELILALNNNKIEPQYRFVCLMPWNYSSLLHLIVGEIV